MRYAIGTSVYNNKVKLERSTVKQLFKSLETPETRERKDGKYIITAIFSGRERNAKSVESYTAAVIDIDNTNQKIGSIRKTFSEYTNFIYTTHRHKKKGYGNRYRVVIPYKKPLSPKKHVTVILYLMSLLGSGNVDTSSKALSRPMYLPACPKSRLKHFKFWENKKGEILRVTPEMEFAIGENALSGDDLQDPFDPTSPTDEGDRNNAISRYVGKLISQGYSFTDVMDMCQSYNEVKVSNSLSKREVKVIVKSVFGTHKNNNNDSGWGYQELLRRIDAQSPKELKRDYQDFLVLISKSRTKLKSADIELLLTTISDKTRLTRSGVKAAYKEVAGEVKKDEDKEESGVGELSLKELKDTFGSWCYISTDDRMYCIESGSILKTEGFSNEFAHCVDTGTVHRFLLKHKLVKIVRRREFSPGSPAYYTRENERYVNTYVEPEISALPGDVTPMEKHFEFLIDNEIERNILLDYIAFLIQFPGVKIKWMPILKGWKGTGKSIIEEKILTPLLGYHNVRSVDSKFVKSDFNSWVLDRQLIVFHELKLGESRREKKALTDAIKSIITDHTIEAHRKGVDLQSVINKANLFGLTNYEDAILITEDERRFCMIRSEAVKMPTSYYRDLVKWLDNNIEYMLYYFENRDLSLFNTSDAPDTRYTSEVKAESHLWPASILIDALEDSKHFLVTDGISTWDNIVEYVREQSSGQDILQAENLIRATSSQGYRLTNALKEIGFRKWSKIDNSMDYSGDRIRINSKLQFLWVSPDRFDEMTKMDTKKIRSLIKKQKFIGDFR